MKYQTIVADPPWPVGTATSAITLRSPLKDNLPYRTMTIEDIEGFPIDKFAAENSLLFLWATNGKIDGRAVMDIAFDVVTAWDFRYDSIITWVKNRPMSFWSPIMSTTEHVVFAWRGKQPLNHLAKMKSVFKAPWRGHSVKPDKFYRLLAEWTPEPRVDLFARSPHAGFDGWGDEFGVEPHE